jgi:hypothetical protein
MNPGTTEVKEWLQKAKQDLLAAKVLLEHVPPVLEPACFHCQQAVEKILKAFLVWKSIPFDELSMFTVEQKAFLKTLANMGETGPYWSNEVEKLASTIYGLKVPKVSKVPLIKGGQGGCPFWWEINPPLPLRRRGGEGRRGLSCWIFVKMREKPSFFEKLGFFPL